MVTLADPEGYGNQYKEWRLDTLPMMPEHFKLDIIKQTNKQYQAVKTQLYRKDVVSIVIATDAGREGELVARYILDKSGVKKPIKRLWISSVTDKAIRDGFAHLKDGREYDNLYRAAQSRAEADWLVGINATRALTCKYNAQLSCGRVQTPTLAMIAHREEEIKRFKPTQFYTLQASMKEKVVFQWRNANNQTQVNDKHILETVQKIIDGQEGIISTVKTDFKRTPPPLLYDLTELQRDCNQRFDFSAKQTDRKSVV